MDMITVIMRIIKQRHATKVSYVLDARNLAIELLSADLSRLMVRVGRKDDFSLAFHTNTEEKLIEDLMCYLIRHYVHKLYDLNRRVPFNILIDKLRIHSSTLNIRSELLCIQIDSLEKLCFIGIECHNIMKLRLRLKLWNNYSEINNIILDWHDDLSHDPLVNFEFKTERLTEHNKDKLNKLSSTISGIQKFYVESANNFQTGFEKIECTLKNGFNQLEKIWSEQKQKDNRASNFFQSSQFSSQPQSQQDFTDSDSSSDSFIDDSEEEAELEPLKYSEVPNLFLQARSIQHFSVLLMMRLFKRSELTSEYNVNDKTIPATDQKKALDPMRIDNIRKIVLDKVEGDEKKKKRLETMRF
ncbi:unnamed protein product [Brachionus calyciflorus]|uniref:Uncharacterized protein n=1 Tax=Brachionus calyciflorus TaxID=104777 RepID=A0A814MYT2_9BILA|nr:unnamed protein product [Brachionus calyciflorus]